MHPEEAVHCDSRETQNWDEAQQDDHTADEETAVEWSLHSPVHHHGQRYDPTADHEVGHSQTDDEAVGGLVNALTGPQRQHNQRITQTAANGDEHLQQRVDHLFHIHGGSYLADVWSLMVSWVCSWVWSWMCSRENSEEVFNLLEVFFSVLK